MLCEAGNTASHASIVMVEDASLELVMPEVVDENSPFAIPTPTLKSPNAWDPKEYPWALVRPKTRSYGCCEVTKCNG